MSGTVGMTTLPLSSSPLKLEEEAMAIEKQGIVSILGSDTKLQQTKASSLRRTLSVDMSSKKWLAEQGFFFSPMKRIASSQEIAIAVADSSLSSEGEEEEEEEEFFERPGQGDVWRSIQLKSQNKKEIKKPEQVDTWSSILSQKMKEDNSALPPPYVHPLVKKLASSLNKKSLEVCTESLGSETSSDGFSSYPSSETGDIEEDKEGAQQPQEEKESQYSFKREELPVEKYNYYSTSRKLPLSPFPPPLPSLTHRDRPFLHVQSHRKNGRLVLEATSTPSKNNFRAHRQDGHLILNFASQEPNCEEIIDQHEDEVEEIEEVFENFEEENDNETEEEETTKVEDEEEEKEEEVEKIEMKNGAKEIGNVMPALKLSCGAIYVQRSVLMMKKLMGLENRYNPTWTKKFNEAINLVEMVDQATTTTTATSFNAYEYFWRTKPTVATLINPITQRRPPLINNCSI